MITGFDLVSFRVLKKGRIVAVIEGEKTLLYVQPKCFFGRGYAPKVVYATEEALDCAFRAQYFLNREMPGWTIVLTRGLAPNTNFSLWRSHIGDSLFQLCFPKEEQAREEIWVNTLIEHQRGTGFDVLLFNKEMGRCCPPLPWRNIFISRGRALEIWERKRYYLDPVVDAFKRAGAEISKEPREALQMHFCLIEPNNRAQWKFT